MAAAPKINLGKIPCPCCGEPVALKQSATGKLSYQCQEADCEATGFADQSAAAAKKWMAALPQKAQPAPEPARQAAPAPKPAPNAEPAKKTPPKSAFDFLGLGA